ncbi:MAG: CHAT domain-containing protein [Planctomycetes bacterium]|nr:CHAT domain-containing protein [Planctomycetota bacterium]
MAGAAKVEGVVPLAIQSVHVAAALEQPEFIGEAMQLAAGCCNAQQAPTVVQAAVTVSNAMVRQSRLAALHSLIAGADAAITAEDLDSATRLLADANALGSRRDVTLPRLNAYAAYVAARLAAARGSSIGITKPSDLDAALDRMAGFALNHRIRSRSLVSMPRVYQLGLIQQAVGNSLGANTSEQLLRAYCEDPPIDVWRRDPVDALAGVMVDRSVAQMARLNLAASGGYAEPFLLASDSLFRSRFLQRLPLAGRIAQIRALAGFEDGVLDPLAIEIRKQMGREMADLRAAAQAAGGAAQAAGGAGQAAEGIDPAQAEMMEARACALALARFPLPQSVPPRLGEKAPVAGLPAKTGMLTFTFVGNKLFATLSADGKVSMWPVAAGTRLSREIGQLLREIGVGKSRGNRLPEDDSWRDMAASLRQQLIPEEVNATSDRFDELIVVPDGPLWYLPFEILPIGAPESQLMGDQMAIRYAPTPGFALQPAASAAVSPTIGICADLFFAPRDPEQNEAIIQSIVDVVKDPLRLPQDAETPTSLLGDKVGHLLVASPRAANPKSPLMMSPAPYDQTSPYGTLAAWLRFPVQGPKSVVLCGMRTPVGVGQMGTGDEVFTTLCALHAAGVRSVLLSRWAVGGESTATAIRELVQELPFDGMNAAWARARAVLRSTELNPAAEPLLMKAEHKLEGLTGDQPLFWAGYLLSSPPAQP